MRIGVDEQSAERLAVTLRPVSGLAYWVFGLLFMALGIYVGLALGRATRVHCARTGPEARTCVLEQSRGLGWRRERFPLNAVRGARVDTVTTAISASMQLVLLTRDGERRVELVTADGDRKLALAAELREFLRYARVERVDILEDTRLFGWGFALFLVAAGLLCILALETVRIVADRSSGLLHIAQRRWRRTRHSDLSLQRIRNVEKHCYTIRYTRSCSVVLVLEGGREVSLTRMPLFTDASADRLVGMLRAWL